MTIMVYSVVEDIKRALDSVISNYFAGGADKYINGQQLKFPDCTIYYDIRELEQDIENKNPIISIVGSRSKSTTLKCESGNLPGFVNRIKCTRSVYVKVLNLYPVTNHNGIDVTSGRYADETWGLLNAIVKTKATEFLAVGIEKAEITDTPDDASNDQESLLIGTLSFEVDVFSRRE